MSGPRQPVRVRTRVLLAAGEPQWWLSGHRRGWMASEAISVESEKPINKTMDLDDLKSGEALAVIDELNCLIVRLKARNLKISSWYGKFDLAGDHDSPERVNRGYGYEGLEGAADDRNFPWFLYWEIVWVVLNNEFRAGDKVLDLGGSSSLFSFYLASKGVDVTTIDIQKELVDNANCVAKEMRWKLRNFVMDMRELEFDSKFEHITSICVYEHIPMYDRVTINRKIKDLLVEGGRLSLTVDYGNPSRLARIGSPRDVDEQLAEPSGLRMRGNREFFDNGKRYLLHPFYYRKRLWRFKIECVLRGQFSPSEFFRTKDANDYTFGALFLERVKDG